MSEEGDEGITHINLNGIIVQVDDETATLLHNDAVFRENYEQAIRAQISDANPSAKTSGFLTVPQKSQNISNVVETVEMDPNDVFENNNCVWMSRKVTSRDNNATIKLLSLMKKCSKEFDDQKTPKNTLWQKIAKELNSHGFYVGDGPEGAEKCRKKFANLQASYMKYKDKKGQTGQGVVSKPPYLDEIEEILGTKDKVTPKIIIDSINFTEKDYVTEENEENEPQPSTSTGITHKQNTPKKNKFLNIKTSSKPAEKNKVMEQMIQIQKKDMEERRDEFSKIMRHLETTAQQRHEEIMALLSKGKGKKKKKRF